MNVTMSCKRTITSKILNMILFILTQYIPHTTLGTILLPFFYFIEQIRSCATHYVLCSINLNVKEHSIWFTSLVLRLYIINIISKEVISYTVVRTTIIILGAFLPLFCSMKQAGPIWTKIKWQAMIIIWAIKQAIGLSLILKA